jgi:aspartyl-tRNA(Asn)/glutamyl-tRNA(Gln) amidotransferase subunit A
MINSSFKQLSSQLAAKKFSSVELTQLYLDRISALNPALNAYITLNSAAWPRFALPTRRLAQGKGRY